MKYKLLTRVKLQQWVVAFSVGKGGKKTAKRGIIFMSAILCYCMVAIGFMLFHLCEMLSEAGFPTLYLCLAGIMVFGVSAVTSMFSVAQQIYSGKDTEMLQALPVTKSDIVLSRFTATVVIEILFSSIVAIPGYAAYAYTNGFSLLSLIAYVIGCICLVFIATGFGSLVSCMIQRASGLIKNKVAKSLITTVLMVAFIGAYSAGMGMLQGGIATLVLMGDKAQGAISAYAKPVMWFAEAIEGSCIKLLPLIILSVGIIALTAALLTISYNPHKAKSVSEKADTAAAKKSIGNLASKTRSPIMAIAMKDVSRFFSNAGLLMNGGLGAIFALIAGVIFAAKGADIAASMPGMEAMVPAIGLATVAGCCSFTMGSCAFLSLEGPNLWVLKSAPLKASEVLLAKSLAHMICMYPPIFLGSAALCFMGISPVMMGLCILAPLSLTLLIALLGSLINLMVPKFDWENEVIAIKQGVSSLIGMFSGMLLAAAGVGIFFAVLSAGADIPLAIGTAALVYILLAAAVYGILKSKWAQRKYNEL